MNIFILIQENHQPQFGIRTIQYPSNNNMYIINVFVQTQWTFLIALENEMIFRQY